MVKRTRRRRRHSPPQRWLSCIDALRTAFIAIFALQRSVKDAENNVYTAEKIERARKLAIITRDKIL